MISPEKNLWCAVIHQALVDAAAPNDTLERKQALNWLTTPNRDFAEACHLAGFEPEFVRAKAKALISSNPRKSDRGKLIEFKGRSQTLTDWAREYSLPLSIVYHRVHAGWPLEQALTTPQSGRKRAGVAPNFSKNVPDRLSPTAQDSI